MPRSSVVHLADVKILNMFNFRILAVDVADNANDVEAIIGDGPIMEIVRLGVAKVVTVLLADGIKWGA